MTNEQIVERLVGAEVAAAAITDHHVIDVRRVQELQSLAGDRLTVFPGIECRSELGGRESVHFIGIFPEDCDIASVWTKLQGPLKLTPAEVTAKGVDSVYVHFRETAELIHELGGVVTVHAGRKKNSLENVANVEKFKRAMKTDLARECIDILEVGRPDHATAYRDKVFPAIGQELPLIVCSDNHSALLYTGETACWIKADPTFAGLQQIIHEPSARVHLGGIPPDVGRVAQHATKYIRSLTFSRAPDAKTPEVWFDGIDIPINPGLVAIIGNKGSGKSALAETIGLLGNTRRARHFSFLSRDKFRSPRENKAGCFVATLEWESGTVITRSLAEDVDAGDVETVRYIPQNYLETICNELREGEGGLFEQELKDVIFSHVETAARLGQDSLDALIAYKTSEVNETLSLLRADMRNINAEIVALEERCTDRHRTALENQVAEKRRELEAHDEAEPAEVPKPAAGPEAKEEQAKTILAIDAKRKELAALDEKISVLSGEREKLAKRLAAADTLLARIRRFENQTRMLRDECAMDAGILGVDIKDIIDVEINLEPIDSVRRQVRTRTAEVEAALDPLEAGSAASLRTPAQEVIEALQQKLDAPNRKYQAYLESLAAWKRRRTEIIGDAEAVGSLEHLTARRAALDAAPEMLREAEERRRGRAGEIHAEVKRLAGIYRDLHRPVQAFIDKHGVASESGDEEELPLSFQVSVLPEGFTTGFFEHIDQRRRGSFMGREPGGKVLGELLAKADFSSADGVVAFLDNLVHHLDHGVGTGESEGMATREQLREGVSIQRLYDFVFALEYLRPRYALQWSGKNLDELSPGERGTLLLVFYLLIDKRDIPLVIDQPEENLDNQTVHSVLVPCIREAKTRRQVIIVTHNPNLAVVGDADQVICASLDKKASNRITYECGAIENPKINRRVTDVLEGTMTAFEKRGAKYRIVRHPA
ncbi:MAG: ABC transporter [Candidatus Brocadiae bacterium]|nr:ABC transporter [Candidatus Brocadiia bacterium]